MTKDVPVSQLELVHSTPASTFDKKKLRTGPRIEKGSCAVAINAYSNPNKKSNEIIAQTLEQGKLFTHRGGMNNFTSIGDGAGVIIDIPEKLLQKYLDSKDIDYRLVFGQYVVGMLFLPQEAKEQAILMSKIEEIIHNFYLPGKIINWRDVPLNYTNLSQNLIPWIPSIKQIIIDFNDHFFDLDLMKSGIIIDKLSILIQNHIAKVYDLEAA